ncbi:hypothetical protein D3C71_1532750 [compost metagenome]
MASQAQLQAVPEPDEGAGHQQVEQPSPEVHGQVEGLREDAPGLPHHIEQGDHADHCAALEQQDDLVAQGRKGDAVGIGQDDGAVLVEARQAHGHARLDLPIGHGAQAAPKDFHLVGRGVEDEGQQRAVVGVAEEPPEPQLAQLGAKLTRAVIDQKQLGQQRCATKERHIQTNRPAQQTPFAAAGDGQGQRQGAGQQRGDGGKLQGQAGTGQQLTGEAHKDLHHAACPPVR